MVARPLGTFISQSEFLYQTLRCNVDLLKIIQLGITLSDSAGNVPSGIHTWQFNFKFSLEYLYFAHLPRVRLREDAYAQESIDLLLNSGIDFKQHQERGIDVNDFGELLISSGMILVDDVTWISFHRYFSL